MKQSLLDSFNAWTDRLEGHISWMYLDTHTPPLVTVGRGNLIDPITLACGLAFVHADGTAATIKEIRQEWNNVKAMVSLSRQGGQAFGRYTTLRLPDAAIDELCMTRLLGNESLVRQQFPQWDTFPAYAQRGLMSMAWARGPSGFHQAYPRFSAFVDKQEWHNAAGECFMHGCSQERNVETARSFMLAMAGDPDLCP
jgi:GH24 family phage-related lysozyme (muramidase)